VFNIGGGEILVVLLIAMVVLGPERLPKVARDIGRALAEFRRITSGVQSDLKEAMGADEFRESMESLRSVVDLKSSIKGELQGLTTSLTSAISETASYGTGAPAAWSAVGHEPDIEASAEKTLADPERDPASIPPPDGMYTGDELHPTHGDLAVPPPPFFFEDVHSGMNGHAARDAPHADDAVPGRPA
jgi:sec-independent protein translocase protein TatB